MCNLIIIVCKLLCNYDKQNVTHVTTSVSFFSIVRILFSSVSLLAVFSQFLVP